MSTRAFADVPASFCANFNCGFGIWLQTGGAKVDPALLVSALRSYHQKAVMVALHSPNAAWGTVTKTVCLQAMYKNAVTAVEVRDLLDLSPAAKGGKGAAVFGADEQ